jgi:hypothetical protein
VNPWLQILFLFQILNLCTATTRRMKGTKEDGSGLTAWDALAWTWSWTTAYTPLRIAKCMLWLLAQCVHPVGLYPKP